MRPSAFRRCGVLIVAAVLTIAFAWNAAQGQFRPPRSPFVRPPGMNPPGMQPPRIGPPAIGPSTSVWKCPKCGYEYRGAVPPSTCPGCQSQMNNGVGNGIPGPGGMMNSNPAGAPAFVPPAMNPNPPVVNPNPPVPNFTPPAANVSDPTNAPSDSAASSGGLSRGKIIGLVIGVIIVGLAVLVGGTCLLIYTLKSGESRPRPRRRPRRDDY